MAPLREGMSDEEWTAALRESGARPPAVVDDLATLLAECAEVKYAGERPTRFAVAERLERAEKLLARLDDPTEPVPAEADGARALEGGAP